MDTDGLIVEDGYVIVGRAGQRVVRLDGLAQGRAASRTDVIAAVRRSESEIGAPAPLAEEITCLAGVRSVSGGWLPLADLSGSGSTRPGI